MIYSTRTTCRCCGSSELVELFTLGDHHVNGFPLQGPGSGFPCPNCRNSLQNAVPDGSPDMLRCASCKRVWQPFGPKVPISLQLCRSCTLVQAKHAPAADLYSGHYWYTSGRNQSMRDALAEAAAAILQRCPLADGDWVMDIGANDGTMLKAFTELAPKCRTIAVEPASNLLQECQQACNLLIADFWKAEGLTAAAAVWEMQGRGRVAKPKVITAFGMLYDMEDPNQFIADVAKALAPDGVFVAQLMCLRQTLAMRDVGNLCHEHLEFYSLRSLVRLLGKHGLEVFDLEENAVNGGSYRLWIAHRNMRTVTRAVETARYAEVTLDRSDTYDGWFEAAIQDRHKIVRLLGELAQEGRSIWGYGASTKGNTLLQWWDVGPGLITAVADRSPEKWGRVMLTGIPIASEEQFRAAKPDYAVVMPYSFLPEFVERERAWLDGGGTFIVPLPTPRLVTRDGEVPL